jgi:septum formation protein
MADQPPSRLTVASGSLGRRELLRRAGYAFDILPSNIDEPTGAAVTDVRAYVQQLAWLKAQAVAPRVADGIVLAADTVGWLDGQVIGKPEDEADAGRILRALAGREHELWTGACLWRRPDDLQLAWQEMTVVAFKALSDAELEGYLATRQWQGCSGAYAIQERNDPFVRVVRGSLSNVVGLPMETLERVLPLIARR